MSIPPFTPTPDDRRFLAIEIGGTKLQLAVGDSAARILRRFRATVNRHEGGPGICRQIEQALAQLRREFPFHAVGVGFGGPVDWRTGQICCSHQIPGWENFQLAHWLRQLTDCPVAIDNDANLAALAESLSGAGQDASPLFYVTLGSGVGAGLTVNGRIYHGQTPGECEFGHIRLDRAGNTVESRCSGWAIDQRIRQLRQSHPNTLLANLIGDTPGAEARHLSTALTQNDPAAGQILDSLADDLAFALSHPVHLFHPQAIILGGGLSLLGQPLRSAVANALPQYLMNAFRPGPDLRLAALGEDVVPVGALHLARLTSQHPPHLDPTQPPDNHPSGAI